MNANENSKRRHLLLLAVLAVGMFGFAFALVPLYDVFCELTGLNGRTTAQATARDEMEARLRPVQDRVVTVQFLAQVGKGMSWEFRPTETQVELRPGQVYTTNYYARSRSVRTTIGQAVPSISPGRAAVHLRKVECFCFNRQELEAGAEIEMPVTFFVDDELPEGISTLSLSYTLFPVVESRIADTNGEAFSL